MARKEGWRRKGSKSKRQLQALRKKCAVGACKVAYDKLRKAFDTSASNPEKFNHYLAQVDRCMRDCSGHYHFEVGGKW